MFWALCSQREGKHEMQTPRAGQGRRQRAPWQEGGELSTDVSLPGGPLTTIATSVPFPADQGQGTKPEGCS